MSRFKRQGTVERWHRQLPVLILPSPYPPYQIQAVDAPAGIVRLLDPEKGKAVDWQPARWGGDVAEALTEQEQEFRTGDKVGTHINVAAWR